MKTLLELFNVGMMREYPEIKPMPDGIVINLGAGKKLITGSVPLDYPEWNAENDPIPYESDSVDGIHCYHLLEHLENVPYVISECRRVLKPGGIMNVVVPYGLSVLQAQDLDHKTAFAEKTFFHLFNTDYYSKGKVKPMKINISMIMGDRYENLALLVQLEKPLLQS